MTKDKLFKLKIDKKNELDFFANNKAFFPTGTSEFLFKTVHDRIDVPGSILDLGCVLG